LVKKFPVCPVTLGLQVLVGHAAQRGRADAASPASLLDRVCAASR
jgi:hypothetical protein